MVGSRWSIPSKMAWTETNEIGVRSETSMTSMEAKSGQNSPDDLLVGVGKHRCALARPIDPSIEVSDDFEGGGEE